MHTRREVKTLTRDGERWIAWAADGAEIASAPVCVLANAHDAARLATLGGRALKRIRGQITRLSAGTCGPLHAVLAGTGVIWCPPDGVVAGASYDLDDANPAPRASGHAGNLARLAQMLSDPPRLDAQTLGGGSRFGASLWIDCH